MQSFEEADWREIYLPVQQQYLILGVSLKFTNWIGLLVAPIHPEIGYAIRL